MTYNAAAWLVDRHVEAGDGDRLAVVCGEDRLSYADLQRQVWRAQNALASLGIRRTERIVLVMDDEPNWLAWFLGALRSGVVPVPLSTMLTPGELAPIVADAVAGAVVASARHAERAGATVVVDGDDWGGLDDRSEAPVAPTGEDSPAFWLYSSGTTGLPKGVMHRHYGPEATVHTMAETVLRVRPDDRFLAVPKLFFAYGLGTTMTFPFAVGATAILNPAPSSRPGSPPWWRPRSRRSSRSAPVRAGLRTPGAERRPVVGATGHLCGRGAARRPAPALHRALRGSALDVLGSTEALHCFVGNHEGQRAGTSGEMIEGYELELLDENDVEATEPDTPGYLHVRGPSVATGYWSRYEATKAAFRGDWLKTGDVYTRSADGYYTFLGRNSDMIKAGGIWVSPAEVEAALIEHPDVLEVAVVGPRDEQGLEQVAAVVVPRAPSVCTDALEAPLPRPHGRGPAPPPGRRGRGPAQDPDGHDSSASPLRNALAAGEL